MADKFYENLEAIVGSANMAMVDKTPVVNWAEVSSAVYEMVENKTIMNPNKFTFVPDDRINRDALLAGMQYTPHNAAGHPGPGYDAYSYGICFGSNLFREGEYEDTPTFYSYSIYTMVNGTKLHWYAYEWDNADAAEKAELTRTVEADMKARNSHGEPEGHQLTELVRIENHHMMSDYFPQNGVGQRLLVLTADGDRIPLPVYLERFPVVLQDLDENGISTDPRVGWTRCLENPGTWTDYQTFGHVRATIGAEYHTTLSTIQIMINAAADYYKRDNQVVALSGFN